MSEYTKFFALAVFIFLALAGNYASLTMFNSISFIFGSIAALVAVQVLGLGFGALVAVIGATYTLGAWGHPYAMMIFTVEVIAVGLLTRRGYNIAMADAAFWLVIGFPLVLLTYSSVLGLSLESAAFIGLKQGVNGVFNAVVAGLVLAVLLRTPLKSRLNLPQVSFNSLVFQVVAFVAIISSASLIVMQSRADYARLVSRVDLKMSVIGTRAKAVIESGAPVSSLSTILGEELAVLFASFDGDISATHDVAVGVSYADGRVQDMWGTTVSFGPGGVLFTPSSHLYQWEPLGDMAEMVRARAGRYVEIVPVSSIDGITEIRIELSAAQLIDLLEEEGSQKLLILAFVTFLILLISRVLVNLIMRPLLRLASASEEMALSIVTRRHTKPITPTLITEYDMLAASLDRLSRNLVDAFQKQEDLNKSLEERVRTRTAQLDLLSQVARQTTNGVIVTDCEGKVTWLNEAFERLSGYSLDDMIGKVPGKILQRTPPPDRIMDHMRNCIANRKSFTVEVLNHTKTGHPYWVEVRCNPLWDISGNHTGFIAIESDVTERRATTRAMNDYLERLHLATQVAALGVWTYMIKQGSAQWNSQNYCMHGLVETGLTVSFEDWLGTVVPADAGRIQALFQSLKFRENEDFIFEYRVMTDKGARSLSSVARPIWENDQLVGFTGVTRDVTDERRTNEKLRQAAQRTSAILDNVMEAIIAVDTSGTITAYNHAAERTFGYPPEEILGRNVSQLMEKGVARTHDKFMFEYLVSGTRTVIGQINQFKAVRRNGEVFPIELAVSEIKENDERFFIGIIRDITERQKVEKMQSQFLATVSHELRTPLTSIWGTLSLVKSEAFGKLDARGGIMIDTALNNAGRLGGMIDNILDFESMNAGQLDIKLAGHDLHEILDQACELNQPFANKFNVSLKLDTDQLNGLKVKVDDTRAVQVLTNYISNAVKYSDPGAEVTVKAAFAGEYARVSVIDNGPGIPKEKQALLFKKFSQLDTSDARSHGGSGLGLAIVHELATRMGGRVGLVSNEGKGSEFWVEFLVEDAAALPAEAV